MLREKIQMDDAYLGGERACGKVGLGSKNNITISARVPPAPFARGKFEPPRSASVRL